MESTSKPSPWVSVIFFISWAMCRAGSNLSGSLTRMRSVLEATLWAFRLANVSTAKHA
jgi:hypothetical protein